MKTSEELAQELERKIKLLENKLIDGAFDTDGRMNLMSIIKYLIKGDTKAKKKYMAIVAEYQKLKSHPDFEKKFHSICRPETLASHCFYNYYVVRRSKNKVDQIGKFVFVGTIIKFPTVKDETQYDDSEAWKKVLRKEKREIELGDTVIYTYQVLVELDGEALDLVSHFDGIIKNRYKPKTNQN